MERKVDARNIDAIKEEARKRASGYELQYHGCGQSVMLALQEVLGLEDKLAFKAASDFCGGIGFQGKFCGALAGGLMILGMKYGRSDMQEKVPGIAKGILPAYKLMKRFEQEFGTTVCLELTDGLLTPPSDEEINLMGTYPELTEGQGDELAAKCSPLVGKTAAMVIEIISEQES